MNLLDTSIRITGQEIGPSQGLYRGRTGFELMIPVFQRLKVTSALDRTVTGTGLLRFRFLNRETNATVRPIILNGTYFNNPH